MIFSLISTKVDVISLSFVSSCVEDAIEKEKTIENKVAAPKIAKIRSALRYRESFPQRSKIGSVGLTDSSCLTFSLGL